MTNIYKKFIDNKKSELPYIKLNFGESFTGKFKGAPPKKNRWGKNVLSYAFLDDEGRRKEWDNGSPLSHSFLRPSSSKKAYERTSFPHLFFFGVAPLNFPVKLSPKFNFI